MAVKVVEKDMVHVFDYFEDERHRAKYLASQKYQKDLQYLMKESGDTDVADIELKIKYARQWHTHIRVISYKPTPIENVRVLISHNFKQIFFSDDHERFIID